MKNNKNVILDLDQTLIWATHSYTNKGYKGKDSKRTYNFKIKIGRDTYFVFKRPGLDNFLKKIFEESLSVSIWTAATKVYCDKIVNNIFTDEQKSKLKFIWTRNKTISKDGYYYLKDLNKVFKSFKNFNTKNTILIDDNPNHFIVSPCNVKYIKAWETPKHSKDNELSKILRFLSSSKSIH